MDCAPSSASDFGSAASSTAGSQVGGSHRAAPTIIGSLVGSAPVSEIDSFLARADLFGLGCAAYARLDRYWATECAWECMAANGLRAVLRV